MQSQQACVQTNFMSQYAMDRIFINSGVNYKDIIDTCDELSLHTIYPKLYQECVSIRDKPLSLFENIDHFHMFVNYCKIIPQIRNFIYFYFNTTDIDKIPDKRIEYANIPDVFMNFIKNNLDMFKEIVIYEFNSNTNHKHYDKLHFNINIFPLNDCNCEREHELLLEQTLIGTTSTLMHKSMERYRLMIIVSNNYDQYKKRKDDDNANDESAYVNAKKQKKI
jgi:hypothetical protein